MTEDHCKNRKNYEYAYRFYTSCSIDHALAIEIRCLQGGVDFFPTEVYIEANLFSSCKRFNECPISTSVASSANGSNFNWNETVEFPFQIKDLSNDASIKLTAWNATDCTLVGETSFPLFNSKGHLYSGVQKFTFHPKDELHMETCGDHETLSIKDTLLQADQLKLDRQMQKIPGIDWLDNQMNAMRASANLSFVQNHCIEVCLPQFQFPVIYEEKLYPFKEEFGATYRQESKVCHIMDWKDEEKHPSEGVQHLKTDLGQTVMTLTEPEFQPDYWENLEIEALLKPSNQHLTDRDKFILWRARNTVKKKPHALPKLLMTVDYENKNRVKEAKELLEDENLLNLVETVDALQLLGKDPTNPNRKMKCLNTILHWEQQHLGLEIWSNDEGKLRNAFRKLKWNMGRKPERSSLIQAFRELKWSVERKLEWSSLVRDFAVRVLKHKATTNNDQELSLYLLYLVQSLRYDGCGTFEARYTPEDRQKIEAEKMKDSSPIKGVSKLAQLLIERACKNFELANYLYWYVKYETYGEDNESEMYKAIMDAFEWSMTKESETKTFFHQLQHVRFPKLLEYQKQSFVPKGLNEQKEKLLGHLREEHMLHFEPTVLPLDPKVKICGMSDQNDDMIVFSSAMQPTMVKFLRCDQSTNENSEEEKDEDLKLDNSSSLDTFKGGNYYCVILKTGDDLRQDQLIVQLISLMSEMLREVLELPLTPYKILAQKAKHGDELIVGGLVQFVENSKPLAKIENLKEYLEDLEQKGGGSKNIKDNFIKSTAGYCVVTYLLGVYDRHLDNIMISQDGRLFHIDFGYVFNGYELEKQFKYRWLADAFRLTPEMVEAMGGIDSEGFEAFQNNCCIAFKKLRSKADLIVNLLYLMVDSGIDAFACDPTATIEMTRERFKLDLETTEEVDNFFRAKIREVSSSWGGYFTDVIHAVGQRLY